jgi:hypothetical protein
MKLVVILTVLSFHLSAHALPPLEYLEGYVKGDTTCNYLIDVYEAAKNGNSQEYDRTDFHRQFKLVARGYDQFAGKVFDRNYNFTKFEGKGAKGSTVAKLDQDAITKKITFAITIESEDDKGVKSTKTTSTELTLSKGTWEDYQKGLDVEFKAVKSDVDSYIAQTRIQLDYTWETLRDQYAKSYCCCHDCHVDKVKKGTETATGDITARGNLKKLEFSYPKVSTDYQFTGREPKNI